MADYRKLWLVNSMGNKYYLTDDSKNKTFLNSPTGFGFRANYKTRKISNSELLISEGLDMVDITGELLFYASSPGIIYADYQEFINFIKFKPLKLFYLTPNFVDDERYSFYADVIISQMTKGEMNQNGMMGVQITFHRLSQWLDSTEHVFHIEHSAIDDYSSIEDYDSTKTYSPGDYVKYQGIIYECKYEIETPEEFNIDHWEKIQIGKHYPLVRPYFYAGTGFSGTTINNNGTDEVGFVVTIDGNIENPIFTLFQNNVRYGMCAIKGGTYSHIVINSVDGQSYIYLERDGTVISNPEQQQDFSVRDGTAYFTWCKLKVGESTFSITAGNISTFQGTVDVSFKNSYFSV